MFTLVNIPLFNIPKNRNHWGKQAIKGDILVKSRALITASAGIFILLVAAAFLLSGCTGKTNAAGRAQVTGQQASSGSAPAGNQASSQQQKIKFADTVYAKYAYDISDNATSQRETAALAGFSVQKKQNTNGSMSITLKALEPQYHDQGFVVEPGQTLYFIEGAFGDDSGSREYSLGDDMAVVVDKNGYVIQ